MEDLEQTQQAPAEVVVDQSGTSSNDGQPANKPNDPAQMASKIEMTQADFTREMQRIAEEKRLRQQELEFLNQQVQMQRQHLQYGGQPNVQQPTPQLTEVFGDTAGSVLANQFQQFEQYKLNNELWKEEMLIRQKMGQEYDKYNYQYFNPATGQTEMRNKVLDKRAMYNPLTNQWNTIEDAINSVRSPEELKEQLRKELMEEFKSKQNAGAISQTSAPSKAPEGDGSLDDAISRAFAQHS